MNTGKNYNTLNSNKCYIVDKPLENKYVNKQYRPAFRKTHKYSEIRPTC